MKGEEKEGNRFRVKYSKRYGKQNYEERKRGLRGKKGRKSK